MRRSYCCDLEAVFIQCDRFAFARQGPLAMEWMLRVLVLLDPSLVDDSEVLLVNFVKTEADVDTEE